MTVGGTIFPRLLFPPPYKVSSCHTLIPREWRFSGGRNRTLPPVTGACQNSVRKTRVVQEVKSRTRRAHSAHRPRLAAGRGWRAPAALCCWPGTGSSSHRACKGKSQHKIWELGKGQAGAQHAFPQTGIGSWCNAHAAKQNWNLRQCRWQCRHVCRRRCACRCRCTHA